MTKGIDIKSPGLPFKLTGNTNAILGYWDKGLVCRFANDACKEWFGISPRDMVGKIIKDLPGSAFNENSPYLKAVLKGKVQAFENEVTTVPGQRRIIMTTYCPDFENSKVVGFYVHVADITHLKTKTINVGRKKNELAIQPQENILINVEKTLRSSLLTGFPGIAKLSRMHFISESKLKRDFKEKFNTGIFSYYRSLQMELAEKYVNEIKLSKKQVAAMLNFINPSNFSVCYKKYLEEKSIHKLIDELKKSNDERYKTFITQTPLTIAMFDTEMRFLAASQKWIDNYKLENKNLIGICLYDIFPNTTMGWKKIHEECLGGNISNGEDEFFEGKNGSAVWLRWDIRPWYTGQKQIGGLLIFTEDITATRNKEIEAIKMSEILDKTNEIARIGVWKRDFRNNTGSWSKITKEILEVPEDFDPTVDNALSFYKAGMSRNLARKALKDSLEKGKSFDIEVEMVTAKQNIKKVRVIGYPEFHNGKCERLSGIFQEIIYQKPAY